MGNTKKCGIADLMEITVDKIVEGFIWREEKEVLLKIGIALDPEDIILLTNEDKTIISIVEKKNLKTLKTMRRSDFPEIEADLAVNFYCREDKI